MWREKRWEFPKEREVLPPIQLRTVHPQLQGSVELDTHDWHMGIEPESFFRNRVLKDFERWLDNYLEARIESARAAGLVKGPGKRELQHFVWAAKFQIEGMSVEKIAAEYRANSTHSVTADGVRDAIERVLDLIHLERRRGAHGPKRKAPNTV